MSDDPQPELPANLRFLRLLVTVLTGTMIAGLLIIIALIVIRFSSEPRAAMPHLPETIALPDGAQPTAFTRGNDWVAVVTQDNRILIFDAGTGDLRQTVHITTP